MIRIAEYDAVDPLQVLHLNLLCLDFALTPELAALIRRLDPRPFPGLGVYAVAGAEVAGQVGVFRLPVVSSAGADEVGGVWAVSTHPAWRGQGIATRLLEEAHSRMAAAGLRFSTLATARSGVAHHLYRKQGYVDLVSPALALGRGDMLPVQPGWRAERAGVERLPLADRLFEQIAHAYLGFARRHKPFFPFLHQRGYLDAQNLWLLWQDDALAGYAAGYVTAHGPRSLLRVGNLLLADGLDPLAATAALAQAAEARYVQARLDKQGDLAAFAAAGLQATPQSWGTFMVKPLAADASIEEFRLLYGLDKQRFLISYLDVT